EAEAVRAKTELEKANEELKKARDELETTLARSLLRPFGPTADREIEALWELAENRGDRLWYRFVEQGLRKSVTTRQLKSRGESALHAAVGLDPGKRARVERLLVERSQDPKLVDDQLADIALVASALGDLTPNAARRVGQPVTQAVAKTTTPSTPSD